MLSITRPLEKSLTGGIDRAVYESLEYDKLGFNYLQFRREPFSSPPSLRDESSFPRYSLLSRNHISMSTPREAL